MSPCLLQLRKVTPACWLLLTSIAIAPTCSGFTPTTFLPCTRTRGEPALHFSTRKQISTAVFLKASLLDDSQLLTELLVAGALGFGTDPLVEIVFNSTNAKHPEKSKDVDFKTTSLYGAADSISVAARVYALLLIAGTVLDNATFAHLQSTPVSLIDAALPISLTIWAALTISTIKRSLLLQAVSGKRLGRVALYDKLIDFVVGVVSLSLVLDELSIDISMGLQSVFAAGGVGALIFSLASKDLAEQIVGGFAVQAWDAFEVGDDIKLGDGTEGTVKRIGLVETEITGYDSIVIHIPNSQLFKQRVSNISRIKQSQVKQKLRFKYSDIKKVPSILNDMKQEIQASCGPELITDGSKPFRAVVTNYEADHIQCEVNCHFHIPPGTSAYVNTREQVLLAIARAVEKNDVEFGLPSILYKTSDDVGLPGL